MPKVQYTVDRQGPIWNVILEGRRFGPYSTMDTAMRAAMNAARKAEIIGYEATVVVAPDADTPSEADAVRADA